MPELGPYGSVRGARGNSRPYRENGWKRVETALLTQLGHGMNGKAVNSGVKVRIYLISMC